MPDRKSKLTPKQKKFCQEYLIDLNGTQAAIRAGYSKKTANEQASQLLAKLNIQAEVQKLMKERSERTQITQDRVIGELAKLGFSNMSDYASWNDDKVSLSPSELLTEGQKAAVSEISQTFTKEGGSIKFKLYDKKGALELIGKHLGMFVDKHEIYGKDGKDIIINVTHELPENE
jgi:phage terminase small subunit